MTTTAPSTNPSQSSSNQSGLTQSTQQNSSNHNELNEHMDESIESNNSTQKPIPITNNNNDNDNNDNDNFNPPSTPRLPGNAKLSDTAPLMQHSNSSTEISPQRNNNSNNNKLKEPTTPSMKRHSFDPRNNLIPKTPEGTPHGINNEGTPLLSPSHHIFQTPSSSSFKRRSTDFYQLLKSPELNLTNNNYTNSNEYDLKRKSLDLHKATMNITSLISGNGNNINGNNSNNGSTITESSSSISSSNLLASPGNSGYIFHDNFLLTSPKRSSNGYRVKKKNNAEIKEISENLKTRLNYAALKIQNGWEQKSIEELQKTLSHDDGDETNLSTTNNTITKIIRDSDNDDEDVEIYDAVYPNNTNNSSKKHNNSDDVQDKPMTDSNSTFDNFWKSNKNTLPDYKELNISESKKIDLSNSSNSTSHNNTNHKNNNNSSPAKPNHSSPSKRTPRMTLDQIAKKHANGNAEDALVNALSPKRLSKPPSQPLPPTPGQQQQQQQKILPSLNTEDQAEKEAIMSLMSLSSPVKKSQPFFLPQNNISTTATNAATLTTSRKNSASSNSSNLPSPIKQSAGFNLPISSPYHTRSISLGGTLPNKSSSLTGLNPPFAQLNQPFRTPPASSVSSFPLQQPFEHSKQIIQQQQQQQPQQPLGSQNQYSFPKMSPMRKPNLPLYNNDNEIDQDNRKTVNNSGLKSPRKKRNSSSSNGQFQNITPNSFMISSPSSFQQQQQQHSQSRQHSRVNSANNIVASSPGPTYPLGIHPVINNNNNLDGDDDRTASDYSD